ncbi:MULTISPECIES: class I SAM-dependent methyltransferase [unclassified Streptomyces]|uniref:class I SAM-dependent methyltransferase n=1 Tax=unclassified Streptomyces TaxID=2593676 RepID=UPI0033DD1136
MSDSRGHDGRNSHDDNHRGGRGDGPGHTHGTGRGSGQGHGHGHGHGHGGGWADFDWETLLPLLVGEAELFSGAYREAADWIAGQRSGGPEVRRILDIGSGPGVVTCLLAQAFPRAEVVAVDGNRALLGHALARAERLGLGDRIRTIEAELPEGFGELGDADLVWAGNSLHHLGDQRAALAGFARLLRPGGTVALAEGGLPTRRLPRDIGMGRPGLEARIDVLVDERFARMRAELPDAKEETEDWGALLTSVGLVSPAGRSFLVDFPAPLAPDVREQVVYAFARTAETVGEELSPEDAAVLRRLMDPEDEAGLARRPDVFLLTARSIHTARRAD